MQAIFITATIIIYILIQDAKGDKCREESQQCACILFNKSNNTCSWSKEKIRYNNTTLQGTIDVELPNLASCNSTISQLIVKILHSSEECNKNFTNTTEHSKLKYHIYDSQKLQQCSSSCMRFNDNILTARFEYVYSGCYILEIQDRYTPKRSQLYKSLPTYISTDYKMKLFLETDYSVLPNFRENKELEIVITMKNADFPKPPNLHTLLIESPCENNCTELEAETKVNYLKTDSTDYNETFINCKTTKPNVTWSCYYSKNIDNGTLDYICQYIGLNPGNYSFRGDFLEYTRCNADSIWGPDNVCHWISPGIVVPTMVVNNNTNPDEPMESLNLTYVIIPLVLAVLFLCLITYLYKIRHHIFKYYRNQQRQYNLLNVNNTSVPLDTKEILIIYARDSELFTKMMSSFKLLLSSVENTSVFDMHANIEAMSKEPENWLRKKIFNPNTKVIVFLNNCGLVLNENQTVTYRNPKWQDKLFTYALKLVRNEVSRNYQNLFVVKLAGTIYNTNSFDDLNPATRYELPDNMDKLLENIFSNTHNFDELFLKNFIKHCNECNKFYEDNPDYISTMLTIREI